MRVFGLPRLHVPLLALVLHAPRLLVRCPSFVQAGEAVPVAVPKGPRKVPKPPTRRSWKTRI